MVTQVLSEQVGSLGKRFKHLCWGGAGEGVSFALVYCTFFFLYVFLLCLFVNGSVCPVTTHITCCWMLIYLKGGTHEMCHFITASQLALQCHAQHQLP